MIDIHIRDITFGDIIFFEELYSSEKTKEEKIKEFFIHQVKSPSISLDDIKKLNVGDVSEILKDFILKHEKLSENYEDTGDFLEDFNKSINLATKEIRDQMKSIADEIVSPFAEAMREVNKKLGGNLKNIIMDQIYIPANMKEMYNFDISLGQSQLLGELSNILAVTKFQERLQSIFPVFQELAQNITSSNEFKEHENSLNQFYITENRVSRILLEHKWIINPSIPVDIVHKISALKEYEISDKAISDIYSDFYKSDNWSELTNLVKSWENNRFFKFRYQIILDCLCVIKNDIESNCNISNVVLPTIIIQIDGLISDYLKNKGINWTTYKQKKEQFIKNKDSIMTEKYESLIENFFLNVLFQPSNEGKPLKDQFPFNRHKIIHGEELEYGKVEYLIRAILFLDVLAEYTANI